MAVELETQRLLLRHWRESDRDTWAALNADPVVMEHFPKTLTRQESDETLDLISDRLLQGDFGLWALERKDSGDFIGYTGLSAPTFETDFTPCVEIGWRLAVFAWGYGFATEAATAALDHAFKTLGLDEIVSFTATTNTPSIAVMTRLGMHSDPAENFAHPRLEPGHRLSEHVLYRIGRDEWTHRIEP